MTLRRPVDLPDLPWVFSQQSLLSVDEFVRQAAERGGQLTPSQMDAFHRLRVLVPFLRVVRDRPLIERLARAGDPAASQLAHWNSTGTGDLLAARDAGRLHDPGVERYQSAAARSRSVGDLEYLASVYIYSPYQLLLLPRLLDLAPRVAWNDDDTPHADVSSFWLADTRARAVETNTLAVVLSALEARYLPDIVRVVRTRARDGVVAYDRWADSLPPTAAQRWLGIDASWLRNAAEALLWKADQLDPLGDWFRVVREGDPDRWKLLKGRARIAIDLRLAAEIMLRYYEQLVVSRRAKALPKPARGTGFGRDPFASRLKPVGGLEATLTDFGISPQPSVLLVVEGATEELMFSRVRAFLNVRPDPDLITVHDREGVDKDIAALVAYAAAPRAAVERETGGRYLAPSRPLTHLLVVDDAEGSMATLADRARHRAKWVDRILRTLSVEHATPEVRRTLTDMVHVDTWRGGLSFEFAHFTDRQLATGILAGDVHGRWRDEATLLAAVSNLRKARGDLKPLLHGGSKVALAERMWPVLEARLRVQRERGTLLNTPVVRVLDRALTLANRMPRRGVVLPLHAAGR